MLKRMLVVLVALCVPLTMAACGSDSSDSGNTSSSGNSGEMTVKVAVPPGSVTYMGFFLAEGLGYFKDDGIKIDYLTTPQASTSIINGDVNMALSTTATAYQDALAGRPTPILALMNQNITTFLMMRPQDDKPAYHQPYPAGIKALPKGITIGTTAPGTGAAFWLQTVLKGAGLKADEDYHIAYLGAGSSIYGALKSGKIQAATLFPPVDAQATIDKAGTYILKSTDTANLPPDAKVALGAALLVNKDWADDNQPVAKKVLDASIKGMQFLQDPKNTDQAAKILADRSGAPLDAVKQEIESLRSIYQPQVDCARVDAEIKVFVKYELLKSAPSCADSLYEPLAPTKAPSWATPQG